MAETPLIGVLYGLAAAAREFPITKDADFLIAKLRTSLEEIGPSVSIELVPNGVVVAGTLDASDPAEWLSLAMERGHARRIVIDSAASASELVLLVEALASALASKPIADALAKAHGIRVERQRVS